MELICLCLNISLECVVILKQRQMEKQVLVQKEDSLPDACASPFIAL